MRKCIDGFSNFPFHFHYRKGNIYPDGKMADLPLLNPHLGNIFSSRNLDGSPMIYYFTHCAQDQFQIWECHTWGDGKAICRKTKPLVSDHITGWSEFRNYSRDPLYQRPGSHLAPAANPRWNRSPWRLYSIRRTRFAGGWSTLIILL